MGQALKEIKKLRQEADRFRETLSTLSRQREFDNIINHYENIIEELVYESENS